MIFYKNSLSSNVYLRLKFFTCCLKLTYSNISKFTPSSSLGKVNGAKWMTHTLYPIWLHWKYQENGGKKRSFEWTKGTWLFISHFYFFPQRNMIYILKNTPTHHPKTESSAVSTLMEAALMKAAYRGFGNYFCDDCADTDFDFF